MKLTDRLLKIASLVDKDKRLADIGTDHGYIPVYLLNKNTIQYAILGDVNKGPLDNAKKEVMRNNLIDKVDLRLGSGIEVLKPNEVDEIIIAGMGGMLINDILKANEAVERLRYSKVNNQISFHTKRALKHLRFVRREKYNGSDLHI